MPDYDYLPTIVLSLLILCTTGVVLLRPISKQLAQLLAQSVSEKQRVFERDSVQVRDLVDTLDSRLRLVEERLDFTEKMLSSGARSPEQRSEDGAS
jgi:hypothetical protein